MLESSIDNTLKREFPEVRFKLSEHKDYAHLMIVVVKYKDRNKGQGTEFIKRLIELSEQEQKDIYLTPDDSYSEKSDMNKAQLTKWYKSLGFVKKHRDDFRNQNTMAYYTKNSEH